MRIKQVDCAFGLIAAAKADLHEIAALTGAIFV
jgi:hypothetical protein